MTRIFAPPTPDALVHRDAISVANLLLHIVGLVLILAPAVERVTEDQLRDRLVVFLVPPDAPGTREMGQGDMNWNAARRAGDAAEGVPVETSSEPLVESKGDVPSLSAADLEAARRIQPEEEVYTVLEVDSAVVRDPESAAPDYPPHLLDTGLEGMAEVRYIVDTLGRVDTLSYRVLKASHVDFAVAVRRALPEMRFRPAIQSGRRVRQLVEQTFRFKIANRPDVARIRPRVVNPSLDPPEAAAAPS
ncbi:MAG: energy transducer TonB [Gemmatimonadales bacterium]